MAQNFRVLDLSLTQIEFVLVALSAYITLPHLRTYPRHKLSLLKMFENKMQVIKITKFRLRMGFYEHICFVRFFGQENKQHTFKFHEVNQSTTGLYSKKKLKLTIWYNGNTWNFVISIITLIGLNLTFYAYIVLFLIFCLF